MKTLQTLIIILIFSITTTIQAQRMGVRGGVSLSSAKTTEDLNIDNIIGYQVGLVLDLPVTNMISLDASALYARRGYSSSNGTSKGTTKIDYLDIPIDVVVKIGLIKSNILLIGGPYFSYGFNANYDPDVGVKIDLFGDDGNFRRIDSGVNLGIGLEVSKFRISFIHGLGLYNLSDLDEDNIKSRNYKLSGQLYF